DVRPERVFGPGVEQIPHTRSDDRDLPALLRVEPVEKPARGDPDGLDLRDLGIIPHDTEGSGLVSPDLVVAAAVASQLVARTHHACLRNLIVNGGHIAGVELDGAP